MLADLPPHTDRHSPALAGVAPALAGPVPVWAYWRALPPHTDRHSPRAGGRCPAQASSFIGEVVKRRVKHRSALGEDPRDEASAAVEGGLGLGNGGNTEDIHVKTARLHA